MVTKIGIGAFDRVRAISRKEHDQCTPSPFDKNRDGFVIGEGAGILILESETYAKERGADILGEISGYAATSDAFHITAPLEDGSGGSMAIKAALNNSGIDIQDVDYINAHGTATLLNDLAETKAVKSVFGKRAYEIPISSTKSMTGHIMGATGALEAVFCINAIRDNIAPPTINYQTPDPDCDLDYIPNEARQMEINVAVSNAFGFGGHNAVLAFRGYN